VFLDRDGVINRSFVKDGKTYPPYSLKELQILPGVRSALIMLRSAGYLNIVVTNQPDISTGKQSLKVVEAMHSQLSETLAIDHFEVCKHVN
jgi:D-glycero-D-manno-heptose 1,7-bisphosphate phosphatase